MTPSATDSSTVPPQAATENPSGESPTHSPVHTPDAWRRPRQDDAVPLHDWQVALPQTGRQHGYARRARLLVLLTVFVGLLAWILLTLIDAPEKTPVLLVSAAGDGPIPQSPWVSEELERFRLLDGTTFTVRDFVIPDAAKKAGTTGFRESLVELAAAAEETGVVVIYVRLPGAVDDAGRPCLIPPGASAVHTETWLSAEDALEVINGDVFADNVQRLVVFDRCQPAAVWSAGILADTFVERLQQLIERRQDAGDWSKLVVLTDVSSGQRGQDSAALGGSVFGHSFWLGLTGAADTKVAGGDGNRRVSIGEIVNYTRQRTAAWVWQNRRQRQAPAVFPREHTDYDIAWAAPERQQKAWDRADRELRGLHAGRNSNRDELTNHWNARNALVNQRPWQSDPVAWQRLHSALVHLERSSQGGQNSLEQTQAAEKALQHWLHTLGADMRSRSPLGEGAAAVHHRQLAARLQTENPAEMAHAASVLAPLREHAGRAEAHAVLEDLKRTMVLPDWVDVVILQHLVNDAPQASWQRPGMIARVLALMDGVGRLESLPDPVVTAQMDATRGPLTTRLLKVLDHVFVGTPKSLQAAETLLGEAEEELKTCSTAATALLDAIRLRDQAAADLPRLAAWIGQAVAATDPVTSRRLLIEQWLPAARNWQSVEELLADRFGSNFGDSTGASEQSSAARQHVQTDRLPMAVAELDRQLAELWTQVDSTYQRLLDAGETSAAAGEMSLLLETPLLPRSADTLSRTPVQQRLALREKFRQTATSLAIRFEEQWPKQLSATDAAEWREGLQVNTADDALTHLLRAESPHPLITLLAIDKAEVTRRPPDACTLNPRNDLLAQEQALACSVRRSFADVVHSLRQNARTRFDSLPARERSLQAEARAVRRVAMFLHDELPRNPAIEADGLAWRQILTSRAMCMLADFWRGDADRRRPFFAQAADDLLTAARLCDANHQTTAMSPEATQWRHLRKRVEQAERFADADFAVEALAFPQVLPDDNLQTRVRISAKSTWALPGGLSVVSLESANGKPIAAECRQPVVVRGMLTASLENRDPNGVHENDITDEDSARSQSVMLTVRPDQLLAHAPHGYRAVAWFRGHRIHDDFQLTPSSGLTVTTQVPGATPATVTVHSSHNRPSAVVFVLDASASMAERVPREGRSGAVRRLDAATQALSALLRDLSGQQDVHVGVVFYGHRVAAGETSAAGPVRQPRYAEQFPFAQGLQPYEDVETVLPVGRFGAGELGFVESRMEQLLPWGETPLYLSLVQALRQLDSAPADATKSIVVITDGLNYQFNPPPELRVKLEDVLQTARTRDTAMHLLGFGIPKGDEQQARAEFSRLSAATGGSVNVSVRDADRFQQHLRSLFEPRRYFVESPNGTLQAAKSGERIRLDSENSVSQYRVRYEDGVADFTVRGGERLTFEVNTAGELKLPALPGVARGQLVEVSSRTQTGYEVVASRPLLTAGTCQLRLSIRRVDGQFTQPIPACNFTVQPVDADGLPVGGLAACVGQHRTPAQNVPTWDFSIADWPQQAVAARIHATLESPNDDPRTRQAKRRLRWHEALAMKTNGPANARPVPVPGVDWQFRHDGNTLTVIERHAAEVDGIPVRTELHLRSQYRDDPFGNRPSIERVVRRYDPEHRLYVQTWVFSDSLSEVALQNVELEFTRIDAQQTPTWTLTQPLIAGTRSTTAVITPEPVLQR